MALAKFSKFKKERAVIKEARLKEKKETNFKKALKEKLGEIGVSSVAELSEEQINKLLNSLATNPVNEDRSKEIEASVMAAGEPKPAGSESDIAKKHTFDSPQGSNQEDKAAAEDKQATNVEEAKKAVKEDEEEDDGVEDVEKGDAEAAKGSEEEDKGDAKVDSEDDAEKKDHYKGAVKSDDAEIEQDKDEIKDLKKDAKYDKEEEEEEDLTNEAEVTKADLDKVAKKADKAEAKADDAEAKADDAESTAKDAEKEAGKGDEIKNDKEFEEYAEAALKKAHPKDFDEKIAKKVIDGLKKKHDGDYGAMVGALTSGFGG
jgi:hypothetical protein